MHLHPLYLGKGGRAGQQHPGFVSQLQGYGEWVFSRPGGSGSSLVLSVRATGVDAGIIAVVLATGSVPAALVELCACAFSVLAERLTIIAPATSEHLYTIDTVA